MRRSLSFLYLVAVILVAALAFAGCRERPEASGPQNPAHSAELTPSRPPGPSHGAESEIAPDAGANQKLGQSYIEQVVQDTIAKFAHPGMSEYEKATAAFDYVIETTSLTEPVGLDLWRIRGDGDALPSFVENRSLSVLLYGAGMCEDYAAALTVLLRGMGMKAEYVPGLTYSAAGTGLVDHAWTVAEIDGAWYHLDCQLEDNISRRDTIRYKYFMKGDATMYESHRWGQNLIDSKLLSAGQNEEIANGFLYEPCPADFPVPPPRSFTSAAMPDMDLIKSRIEAEFHEYESIHGPLEPIALNIVPPVFGVEGYGPPD